MLSLTYSHIITAHFISSPLIFLLRIEHPADFHTCRILGGVSAPGWAVPSVSGCLGHAVWLETHCPKAASALRWERIGQEAAIAQLTPNADGAGIEAAAHIGIPGIGTATVDFQRLAVHLMPGLWCASNRNPSF